MPGKQSTSLTSTEKKVIINISNRSGKVLSNLNYIDKLFKSK